MRFRNIILILGIGLLTGCSDFLDVIPDNVATIDHAFRDRVSAERYLYTCYGYLPNHGSANENPAFVGGDENIILINTRQGYFGSDWPFYMVRGLQNTESPVVNYWNGEKNGKSMFLALRDCNIFLENIDLPRDLEGYEKKRWIAEVKFLKAYYHYWLFQLYGPIPLVKENLPVNASPEEVRIYREPVDSVVNYIVCLLDEALPDLPLKIMKTATELGRITQPIAAAVKAKTLALAASPLFNGNDDYAGVKDNRGVSLFPEQYDRYKWELAATACKVALDYCESAGIRFYEFQTYADLSDEIKLQMNIRGAVTDKWNVEIVWGATETEASDHLQRLSFARTNAEYMPMTAIVCEMAPSLRVAEEFYTANGVPIDEDKDWNYKDRYKTREAGNEAPYYIKEGRVTANLHFGREPRFYADLGFDGGIWYGAGEEDDKKAYYLQAKKGEPAGISASDRYSQSGYFGKKLVHYKSVVDNKQLKLEAYSYAVIRLADLYLLYAEALLESKEAIDGNVYTYIDEVRKRAGLKGIKDSWQDHSKYPNKPLEREGLLEIIRRERLIELALEGQRFWDLRRWKQSEQFMNEPLQGWNVKGENDADYYQVVDYFLPEYGYKDYLWPIKQDVINVNKNIRQNPGW